MLQSTGVPVQGWRANNTQFKRAFCGVQITKFSVEEITDGTFGCGISALYRRDILLMMVRQMLSISKRKKMIE